MKFVQPITIEEIKEHSWFLFGCNMVKNDVYVAIARLDNIIDFSLALMSGNISVMCFTSIDAQTLEKRDDIILQSTIVEIQVSKEVYKKIEFDNEEEEAKFRLLND